jgi:hypothetical protein
MGQRFAFRRATGMVYILEFRIIAVSLRCEGRIEPAYAEDENDR